MIARLKSNSTAFSDSYVNSDTNAVSGQSSITAATVDAAASIVLTTTAAAAVKHTAVTHIKTTDVTATVTTTVTADVAVTTDATIALTSSEVLISDSQSSIRQRRKRDGLNIELA